MMTETRPCEHVAGVGPHAVPCIAPAVNYADVEGILGEVHYCQTHHDRVYRLMVLAAVDALGVPSDLEPEPVTITSPAVLSCPPNIDHAGTVEWALEGTGNACPACGRFA